MKETWRWFGPTTPSRWRQGRAGAEVPMRPDCGRVVADGIGKKRINPGYSCVGRSRGLAELRGVTRAFAWLERRADRG